MFRWSEYVRSSKPFLLPFPDAKLNVSAVGTFIPINFQPPSREYHEVIENGYEVCEDCGVQLVPHDEGYVCPICGRVYPAFSYEVETPTSKDEKIFATGRKVIYEYTHPEWYVLLKILTDDPHLSNRYKSELEGMFRKFCRWVSLAPPENRVPLHHLFVVSPYTSILYYPSLRSRVGDTEYLLDIIIDIYNRQGLFKMRFPSLNQPKVGKREVVASMKKLAAVADDSAVRYILMKARADDDMRRLFQRL